MYVFLLIVEFLVIHSFLHFSFFLVKILGKYPKIYSCSGKRKKEVNTTQSRNESSIKPWSVQTNSQWIRNGKDCNQEKSVMDFASFFLGFSVSQTEHTRLSRCGVNDQQRTQWFFDRSGRVSHIDIRRSTSLTRLAEFSLWSKLNYPKCFSAQSAIAFETSNREKLSTYRSKHSLSIFQIAARDKTLIIREK